MTLVDKIDQSAQIKLDNEIFELSDVEMETLRRASLERLLPYDEEKRTYSKHELANYGMVREAYTRDELRALGFGQGEVSCFDEKAKLAEEILTVDTPFGSKIKKSQLPIDMMPFRVLKTIFPPNTIVTNHVHPENTPDDPGGGLRIITKGTIFFRDKYYGPGDWFFVPNGVPYEFTTDPDDFTVVFYKYNFFAAIEGNRFSHPHGVDEQD